MMRDWNKFYTCSKCSKIDYQSNAQFLDDNAICYSCLDNIRFAAKREVCARRGYHVTKGTNGQFIGKQPRNNEPWPFYFQLTCECNESTTVTVDVAVTPFRDHDGAPTEIFGIAMQGYMMPAAPKRWFLLEGRPTVLPEEQSAEEANLCK